jgi:hypothetical protein
MNAQEGEVAHRDHGQSQRQDRPQSGERRASGRLPVGDPAISLVNPSTSWKPLWARLKDTGLIRRR